MRKQDIAMVILVAGVSALISYFVIQSIPGIGNPSEEKYDTNTMEAISSEIVKPSAEIFNSEAINPTVQITIGENGEQVISEK